MVTHDDVRRLALALPEVTEGPDPLRFQVAGKAFVWVWLERIDPKRARVPSTDIIVVRVAGELDKQTLIEMDPAVFFTEPHYDGYPAVMVRLADADLELLGVLIRDAWRLRAPKRLVKASLGDSD